MTDGWFVVLGIEEEPGNLGGLSITAMPLAKGLGGPAVSYRLEPDGAPVAAPGLALLEVDERSALVVECLPVRPARMKAKGRSLTLTTGEPGPVSLVVDAADAGLDRQGDIDALASSPRHRSAFGLVDGEGAPARWVWILPGGSQAWLAERAATVSARAVERRRKDRRRALSNQRDEYKPDRVRGDGVFVNPYTFVPLPERVERDKPRGHLGLADGGLSGWFDVVWRFDSDYLLPQDAAPPGESGAVLEIRGSAVKGAVRAVHEVLAAGCLRVFDAEALPVHRETAVQHGDWVLAVVSEIDQVTGAVTAVQECDAVVWIAAAQVHRVVGSGALRSGSRLRLLAGLPPAPATLSPTDSTLTEHDPGGRVRLRGDVELVVDPGGEEWVFHVSDGNARRKDRPYYVAAGRRPQRVRRLEEGTWELFRRESKGSGDDPATQTSVTRTGAPVDPAHPAWPGAEVEFRGRPVGRRRRADGWLGVGDTVWVSRGSGPVQRLKLAMLWRAQGKHPAATRVGASKEEVEKGPSTSPLPCVNPEWLCPTCAVFGSADAGGKRRDAEQRSYGAHVRFGALRSVDPDGYEAEVAITSTEVPLPPLGSPRPSSGMFYLSHDGIDKDRFKAGKDQQPHSYWGSALDEGTPRRLAGRKFYWHGMTPAERFPRHRRREGNAAKQCRTGHVVAAGTACRGRVWFDNLDRVQLGLLLAAVEPALVLHDLDSGQTGEQRQPVVAGRVFATHLGGGKPLGYGTVVPTVVPESLVVETARSRYGAGPRETADVAALAEEARRTRFGGEPEEAHRDDAPAAWYALASVLTEGRVPADRIWYPPALPWSQRVNGQGEDATFEEGFDESFTFFQTFRGGGIGAREAMQPLPRATDADQTLPIPEQR